MRFLSHDEFWVFCFGFLGGIIPGVVNDSGIFSLPRGVLEGRFVIIPLSIRTP